MNDRLVVLVVVIGLMFITLAAILGEVFLVAQNKTLPDGWLAIAAAAAGGLGAILARTSSAPPGAP